jgi:hypothetical protein
MVHEKMNADDDQANEDSMREWIRGLLDSRHDVKMDVVRRNAWVVVPVETHAHFSSRQIEQLAGAFARLGYSKLDGLVLDEPYISRGSVEIPATENGLRAHNAAHRIDNLVFAPRDRSFAIICHIDYFWLVVGKKDVVEAVLGRSIDEARREFVEYAREGSWKDFDRQVLLEIASLYDE